MMYDMIDAFIGIYLHAEEGVNNYKNAIDYVLLFTPRLIYPSIHIFSSICLVSSVEYLYSTVCSVLFVVFQLSCDIL